MKIANKGGRTEGCLHCDIFAAIAAHYGEKDGEYGEIMTSLARVVANVFENSCKSHGPPVGAELLQLFGAEYETQIRAVLEEIESSAERGRMN